MPDPSKLPPTKRSDLMSILKVQMEMMRGKVAEGEEGEMEGDDEWED